MVDEVKKVEEDAVLVRESAGTTPKGAKPAATAPKELTADEINAKQAADAKAAGKEYQGQQPEDRPSVKDMAVEKTAPASGKAEQA
jgi:hypothetical protein